MNQAGDQRLFRTESGLFIRGAGGWGGQRGPSSSRSEPSTEPELVVSYETDANQALLYRLSGDTNPLHTDPEFAGRAGFRRPILHGLCTFGFAGRALLHGLCGSDPRSLASMTARFSAPVYPGDRLHVDIWREGKTVQFRVRTDGETVVLSQGRAVIR
jgi:acyl dehydratase